MRVIRLLIALLCLTLGIVVGALNHQIVRIDLGFQVVTTTLGVCLLVTLLLGALLGGMAVTASVVLPLQQRLRRLRKESATSIAGKEGA